MRRITLSIAAFAALAALGIGYVVTSDVPPCTPITEQKLQEGSQGYRVWFGESLKSFEHNGKSVCVPDGWQAVGATKEGSGWAVFTKERTGVVIKSEAFGALTLNPEGSSYTVTVLYPLITNNETLNRYVTIISSAFSNVEELFPSSTAKKRAHTVLVTAGLAGNTSADGTRVYPDPTDNVSMFVRTPNYPRAEELFIHAVMHLFNRQRADLTSYQKHQDPFPAEDWQEMEAVWSETAFSTWNEGRKARVEYLYNVHKAVRTNSFSLIVSEPFNDKKAFEKIRQGAVVKEGSDYLDYQYGHYVLAPLTMVAIEGLLVGRSSNTHVADLLKTIHQNSSTNFFEELGKTLSKEESSQIMAWIRGEETIPETLVMKGLGRYLQQP